LLDEGHIACANIVPEIVSMFVWKGEREESMEAGALFKTNSALLEAAIGRLAELHPYDVPAILGWRCDAAAPATVVWLSELGS
jgi:periplasmic divalent cation tolerance protein